ncbi:hypothetical protein I4U23_029773 [Adineta vaga]|nr:hypothetical protein I4U23_029773 [Adineta vaga]
MVLINSTTNNPPIFDDDDDFTNILGIIQGSIYIPVFCAGLVNNLLTILIILLNRDMKTITNCYLLNLAISDTLPLIVSLPFEISFLPIKVPWERFGCQIRGLLAETSTNVSILTISAFTIERYLAVCRPLRDLSVLTFQRAIKIQILIWFFAILSSTPYFFLMKRVDFQCLFDPNYRFFGIICFSISTIFFFVLPAFILCFLYALMARRLYNIGLSHDKDALKQENTFSKCAVETDFNQNHLGQRVRMVRHTLPTNSLQSRQSLLRNNSNSSRRLSSHIQSMKKSAFKMLFAVVIAFIICYAPFHAQRLLTSRINVSHLSLIQQRAITIFFFISGILYYVGSTVNPIFYHLFSRKYRLAFFRTMKRIVHCERHDHNPIIQRKHNSLPIMYYPQLRGGPLKSREHFYQEVHRRRKTSIDIGLNKKHLLRLSLPPLALERIR